ncbi:anti-sigma factor antagonist [Neobacillus kokaensis]|uniref:Anti-sigma factor antagonist n=1 Tax=Neobacillus kokaensis TaxID=2759023 RepID=A0ABQ3N570_9BACI|nr:anti-sigma factor antagonist [Neobacillus kokaensis]GHH98767.1 anti-sigma-B factor antagonist [Neobacillus kokaensis]
MDLKIDKQQNDREIFVNLAGEIDAFTAPKLREELLQLSEGQKVIINLKDVSYLDSTGLGVFVGLFKQLEKTNGELHLLELSDRLKRLFELTGLSHVMKISAN